MPNGLSHNHVSAGGINAAQSGAFPEVNDADPATLSWLVRPKAARAVKRVIDVAVAIILAPFVLVTLAVIGLLIKLEDQGPVIYRRRVVGPKGDFGALKLRSMRVDADKILERDAALRAKFEDTYKIKDDPRVTKIGRPLRRSSLDELPQLWNVLRGQMSLVGPRMIVRSELEKFGPYAVIFDFVKPGMTGHWQVSGRQEVSYAERVKMDVYYLQHWSLWFDVKILFKTAWKVFKQDGAY